MTRFARALGSKSSNARVSADPTPWSEMAPPKRASKRFAGNIEEDEGITTPKKEKQTPAKKTPKVVQLTPKSPASPAAASPISAKKGPKKTPLAAKTPNNATTPSNFGTPKSGKMSEPSPLQTRSARKKKAELNSTVGTPMIKGVTPSKTMAGKKLNTPGGVTGTPKAQTPGAKPKGKKGVKVEEEEDEDDLKLALDDDMDSDDVDSDDDLDEEDDSDDEGDAESDEEMESEDEIEKEKRKAELEAILNKKGNRKSILKKVDSPAVTPKAQAKTPAKHTPMVKAEASPVVKVEESKKEATPAKSPAEPVSKTPAKSPKNDSPKKFKASDFFDLEAEEDTPGKKSKNKKNKSLSTTPAKAPEPSTKTPVKAEPAETKADVPVKTPAKQVGTPAKTPAKGAQTPTNNASAKKPAKKSEEAAQSPVKTAEVAPTKVPLTEEQKIERKKARKANKAAKRAKKIAEAATAAGVTEGGKAGSKKAKENKDVVDDHWFPKEKLLIAKSNEERFKAIKEKMKASGKTDEEIAVELPKITQSMLKRLAQTRCLRCRKLGHMQRDCPQSKVGIKCYKCGDTTHTSKACAIKGEVYAFADCYLCHQTGHLTRTCPNNKNGIYPRGGSCYKCQEKTHLAKDCPKSMDENADPKAAEKKNVLSIGVLNSKQSADAEPALDTFSKKTGKPMGKKKQVVKF